VETSAGVVAPDRDLVGLLDVQQVAGRELLDVDGRRRPERAGLERDLEPRVLEVAVEPDVVADGVGLSGHVDGPAARLRGRCPTSNSRARSPVSRSRNAAIESPSPDPRSWTCRNRSTLPSGNAHTSTVVVDSDGTASYRAGDSGRPTIGLPALCVRPHSCRP
jgi:hypothetical protein